MADLVGKGLSNPEIAAELFVSRKAVEYHLGNVHAKSGLHERQQLRHFVEQWGTRSQAHEAGPPGAPMRLPALVVGEISFLPALVVGRQGDQRT